jgi:hypothetical protein
MVEETIQQWNYKQRSLYVEDSLEFKIKQGWEYGSSGRAPACLILKKKKKKKKVI